MWNSFLYSMKANIMLKWSRWTEKHVEQYNPGATSVIPNTAKSPLDVCNWKNSKRQWNQRTVGGKANPGKNRTNKRIQNCLHSKPWWLKSALNSTNLTDGKTNKRHEKVEWEIHNALWIQSEIRRPKVVLSWKRSFLQKCHLRGIPIVISEWDTKNHRITE